MIAQVVERLACLARFSFVHGRLSLRERDRLGHVDATECRARRAMALLPGQAGKCHAGLQVQPDGGGELAHLGGQGPAAVDDLGQEVAGHPLLGQPRPGVAVEGIQDAERVVVVP